MAGNNPGPLPPMNGLTAGEGLLTRVAIDISGEIPAPSQRATKRNAFEREKNCDDVCLDRLKTSFILM